MSRDTSPFFGRQIELEQYKVELRNPRGSAILVVGQPGMGKTMLLNHLMTLASEIPDLKCGTVREEVTSSDAVESVLALLMDQAYEAANIKEGSFEPTPRRLEQWRSLLNIIKVGDLTVSLRRNPQRNVREQFLNALERISEKMPVDGRAVFIIDPEKYLCEKSDQDWAIIVRHLPPKIKLVFAQRPDDVLADSDLFCGLKNVERIPQTGLDVLDLEGFEELVNVRAPETRMTPSNLKSVLARYHRHPYAVVAAIELLASGVLPNQLPSEPSPSALAAVQWKQIQRGGQSGNNGELAIQLFQAYAVLEVAVPDACVEEVSGLNSVQRMALVADRFLGPLLRDESGGRRVYHAILRDCILSNISKQDIKQYHIRAINAYRKLLISLPPNSLAARQLPCHVRAAEGEFAFVKCVIEESANILMKLGLFEEIQVLANQALSVTRRTADEQPVLYEILGQIELIHGRLPEAEKIFKKGLQIAERKKSPEGIASSCTALGNVLAIQGKLNEAETLFQRGFSIEEKLKRPSGIAANIGNLGNIMQARGDYANAAVMYRRAIVIEEQHELFELMAADYINLGHVMQQCGNLAEAETMQRKALAISEKTGNYQNMASAYGNLGVIMIKREEWDAAEELSRKLLVMSEKLGRPEGRAIAYGNLGIVMKARGDLDGAERMYRKSLAIEENLGRIQGMASDYLNLANLMRIRGNLPAAKEFTAKARDSFARLGNQKRAMEMQSQIDRLSKM